MQPALIKMCGASDLTAFWSASVKVMQRAAAHHTAFLWCDYFNFAKSSKSTIVFESPAHARSPDYWEARRRYHLTAGYLAVHAGLKLYRMNDVVSQEKIRKSEFYRQIMMPEGWEFAVTLAFWHKGTLRASVALYRTKAQGHLSDSEVSKLAGLHAIIEAGLFRILDQQQSQAMHVCLEDFLQTLPVGMLLLDWNLQPIFFNEEGCQLTLVWNQGPANARALNSRNCFALPDIFKKTCEKLREQWLERMVPGRPPPDILSVRLVHPKVHGFRATIMTQNVKSVSASRPSFLVRLTGLAIDNDSALIPSEQQIELLSYLSPREREIALLVTQGLSNDEIAGRLRKESSTVKAQLTSIFRKLEVGGRTQLVALMKS